MEAFYPVLRHKQRPCGFRFGGPAKVLTLRTSLPLGTVSVTMAMMIRLEELRWPKDTGLPERPPSCSIGLRVNMLEFSLLWPPLQVLGRLPCHPRRDRSRWGGGSPGAGPRGARTRNSQDPMGSGGLRVTGGPLCASFPVWSRLARRNIYSPRTGEESFSRL